MISSGVILYLVSVLGVTIIHGLGFRINQPVLVYWNDCSGFERCSGIV
jgi:predicted membrane protein